MAELATLARPYAKAAFDYAKENNNIDEWEYFLSTVSQIVLDESFVTLLNNPAIAASDKVAALIDIYKAQSKTPSGQILDELKAGLSDSVRAMLHKNDSGLEIAFSNFTQQLADNDRLALLPEIYNHFGKLKSQDRKQVDAYITTTYPLTEEQRKLLQERLAISTNAIVILHESVDATLLGGATIKVGDKFTDGSVRGKLQQLKTQLTA